MEKDRVDRGQLIQAALELSKALNQTADENLPGKLAGIVKLHAGIAVGSAFIPVPGADIVAAASNIWTMYVRINNELELPFAENLIRSIATGIVTNLGAAAAGYMIVGTAFKFIPGLGSLGGAAVMGATIYGVTIASGIIYMKAITKVLNAKNSEQVNEENLKGAVEELLNDKKSVQTILKTAKKGYKEAEVIIQDSQLVVQKGNFENLQLCLSKKGIDNEDIIALKKAIESDPPALVELSSFGEQVSSWIGKMVSKAATGAWQMDVAISGGFLAEVIGAYYGK